MSRRFLQALLACLGATAPVYAPVAAQPVRTCVTAPCPQGPECMPRPRCGPVQPQVVRASSRVRAELDGRVVRYEVSETYVNRGGGVGEADFLLPLPKGAAFEDLALSINGEMVTGETMNADHARAVYEEIVRRMRDPALVEWMGHGLLRARVFPIQPGEQKRVVVRFRAIVEREGDALRLDWIGSRRVGAVSGDESYSLTYTDDGAFGHAYSPTHALRESREGGRHVVTAEGGTSPLTLLLPVRTRGEASVSLLAHAPGGEDGYALITLSPPALAARSTPRDVVFVLDVSGSMSGQKLEQARAAGRQLLRQLGPTDRFRLIDFSSEARSFRDGWTAATSENIRDAQAYLDGLRANGGTNILGALEEALRADTPSGRLPLVLFLTDGEPTVGETRAEAIAARAADLRKERRIFTFGIGADLNAALLEQLALQGRGTATFVRPEESVERAVGIVADRLTRPVATDVHVRVDGARLYSVQPQGAIDVFAGQDLVVLARYSGVRENATITVEGNTPSGTVHWTGHASLPARSAENAFVARLWAVQRVGYLSAERRRLGANAEVDAELRQLGERFGIPTELTSYLVREPATPVASPVRTRTIDAARAAGGNAVPAPQPVATGLAQASADRFEAARAAAEQRRTSNLGDLQKSQLADGKDAMRSAGTRTFVLQAGVWTDTRPGGNLRVVKVKAFSPAYFALLQRLPELGALLAVDEHVRVHGRRVAVEIADDGVSVLDTASLDAVIRDW